MQEGQERDQEGSQDSVHWYTVFGALSEELWCLSFQSQTIKATTGAIAVRISSRKRGRQNQSVDDIWQNADSKSDHGCDIWRRSCTGRTILVGGNQVGVIVWNQNTDSQRAKHEEGSETPEHGSEGLWKDDSWVLSLSGGHRDIVGTGDGEGSLDQALQETNESAKIAFVPVESRERTRILPISETESIAEWVAAEHGNKSEEQKSNDENDLAQGHPELSLAVPLDSSEVHNTMNSVSAYRIEQGFV